VLRRPEAPFQSDGGLRLLDGNLGRAIVKVSAVAPGHRVVEAPCRVFDSQQAVVKAFEVGEFGGDVVVVVRHQGPKANGMPELHKLTPVLGVLLDRGQKVALVTDGRMSGASGKVLAAIHVTPEASEGGALARLRDGDVVRVDGVAGTLSTAAELSGRDDAPAPAAGGSLGRGYFENFRRNVSGAELGASVLFAD
jgi:phosphogluconate dehydratase